MNIVKDKERIVIVRSMNNEDQRKHFIERLKDRYEITITDEEYDELCNAHGVFHGYFSKNRSKTIGWVSVKGKKVWVLRDGEANRLSTCYPSAVEHSDHEMLRACFGKSNEAVIKTIYGVYLKEVIKISKMKFDSVKDAAIYFFTKTKFAPLHIDKFKNKTVQPIKVAVMIAKILSGENEHVELTLKRKKTTDGKTKG